MEVIIDREDQLDQVVNALLSFAEGNKIVFLIGDLGAGKTTFVKRLLTMLGSEEEASSPTYSLINEYALPKGKLFHIDLYRLEDTYEAQEIGIEEYLDSGQYCFVEWPDIIEHLVDQAVVVKIETLEENARKFEIALLNP
ncbi:MAG: tRNA (adenosine(37)-N6)-threonylcarbamoyltransferase complex ATPase subunit type 1 TsaE [Saprospiraceae bacterium]|nr:tRNA (adenosine(37)-N6)-threonylcarbamoyltransferase complex ATPase subunit type 1 TsaE [Saprospiraceae bacterium]